MLYVLIYIVVWNRHNANDFFIFDNNNFNDFLISHTIIIFRYEISLWKFHILKRYEVIISWDTFINI